MKKLISMLMLSLMCLCMPIQTYAASYVPATGDQSNIKLWIIIMGVALVALIGVIVLAIISRKK